MDVFFFAGRVLVLIKSIDGIRFTSLSHNYSYIWCFSFGLRAMLSFRRWSKYIKNAKFYAESNGCIADFYKHRNCGAI